MKKYTEAEIIDIVETNGKKLKCYHYESYSNEFQEIVITKIRKTLFHFATTTGGRGSLSLTSIIGDLEYVKYRYQLRLDIQVMRKLFNTDIPERMNKSERDVILKILRKYNDEKRKEES